MRAAWLLLLVCAVCAETDDVLSCDHPAYRTDYPNNTFCAAIRMYEENDRHNRARFLKAELELALTLEQLRRTWEDAQPVFDEMASLNVATAARNKALRARTKKRSVLHVDARMTALLAQAGLSTNGDFASVDRVLANITFPDECENKTLSGPAARRAMRLLLNALDAIAPVPLDAVFDNKILTQLQTFVNESCATGHFMDGIQEVVRSVHNNPAVQSWRAVMHLCRMAIEAHGFFLDVWVESARAVRSEPRLRTLALIVGNLSSIAQHLWAALINSLIICGWFAVLSVKFMAHLAGKAFDACLSGVYAWLVSPAPILFTVVFWYAIYRRAWRCVYE